MKNLTYYSITRVSHSQGYAPLAVDKSLGHEMLEFQNPISGAATGADSSIAADVEEEEVAEAMFCSG